MMRLFGIVILLILCQWTAARAQNKDLRRFEYQHRSMGTLFRIICYADDQGKANALSQRSFQKIDSLNFIMSDYLPGSELNELCRQSGNGNPVAVSNELFEVIQLGYEWGRKTNGVFDITVGSLTQLWRRAERKELMPTEDQIQDALKKVGYQFIHLDADNQTVALEKSGMQLDLGGIAKGYAVDVVFEIFEKGGVRSVLVDGGGDLRAGEPPPGKTGWRILIENMGKKPQPVNLLNSAIATSGDLYRFVEIDSVKYSHIIDPRTGYGAITPRTVTIQSKNCTEADVLASILSILKPAKGIRFLRKIQHTKALIILNNDGKIKKYKKGNLDYVQ